MSVSKKRLIIIFSCVGALVVLMIVFGALFSIRNVYVDRMTYVSGQTSRIEGYLDDDIIKESGIKKGSNIMFTNMEKAISKLEKKYPYGKFNVVRTFPNKVTIYLSERVPVFRVLVEGSWQIYDESLKCLEIVPAANLAASQNQNVPTLSGVTLDFCTQEGDKINDPTFAAKLTSIIDGVYGSGETPISVMSDILLEKDTTGVEVLTLTVAGSGTKLIIRGTSFYVEKIAYAVLIYNSQISVYAPDNQGNVHQGHLEDVVVEILAKFNPDVQDDSIRVRCSHCSQAA